MENTLNNTSIRDIFNMVRLESPSGNVKLTVFAKTMEPIPYIDSLIYRFKTLDSELDVKEKKKGLSKKDLVYLKEFTKLKKCIKWCNTEVAFNILRSWVSCNPSTVTKFEPIPVLHDLKDSKILKENFANMDSAKKKVKHK